MEIKNLSATPLEELVQCLLLAFENYYVTMPKDAIYYEQRWRAAKVDFSLSFGMFDQEKLVGFIVHAVDERNGKLTAYNAVTGVIPAYRGRGIVKQIYQHALKKFTQLGVQKCMLEVIVENEKALRAYQSVGFDICKKYQCIGGNVTLKNTAPFTLQQVSIQEIDWKALPNQAYYPWEYQKESILAGDYQCFHVLHQQKVASYFIFHPKYKYIAQFDVLELENNGWERLFAAMQSLSDRVKINNIDERLQDKLHYAKLVGLKPTFRQYEMELILSEL